MFFVHTQYADMLSIYGFCNDNASDDVEEYWHTGNDILEDKTPINTCSSISVEKSYTFRV
jgi:hypothetical protein